MTNPEFSNMDKIRIEKWAAEMRTEAALLERSSRTLEEVIAENEAAGNHENWTEEIAADACRRLAAYLRRDAAAGIQFVTVPQPIIEIDEEWTQDQEGIDALKQTPYAARVAFAAAQAAYDAAQAAYDVAGRVHRDNLDAVAAIVRERDVDAHDVAAASASLKAPYAALVAARAIAERARDDLHDASVAVRYAERAARADDRRRPRKEDIEF